MKIRYIETKPIQQTLEFDDREEWQEFFEGRVKEIIDYVFANNIRYGDYYKYHKVLLNKDGTPRKLIDAKWLHTEEARKKQKKNWLAYCERRNKQNLERSCRKKIAEIDFKIDNLIKQKEELKNATLS